MNPYNSLCEELPYWEFADSKKAPHLILHDGSLSAGLELIPVDIDCFDNDRVNQLICQLRTVVNSISEKYTVQIHVKTNSNYLDLINKHKSLLTLQNPFLQKMDEHRTGLVLKQIQDQKLLQNKVYLYLKSPAVEIKKGISFKTVKKFSVDFEKDYDIRTDELEQTLESLKSNLDSTGISSKILSSTEMTENIYAYLNPKRSHAVSCPVVKQPQNLQLADAMLSVEPELAVSSPRSQLVFSDLILDEEEFILDQKRTRVLTLKTLPEVTAAGQMRDFLKFSFHFDLLFTFKVSDQVEEMKKLEQKRRMAHSLSQTKQGQVSNLEGEAKLSATEELIRELIDTGQKIFLTQLSVIVREDNNKDGIRRLNQKTREVLSQFKKLSGAEGVHETVGSWKIFKTNLPFAPVQLERGKRLKTNNLVDFMPLYGTRRGDETPQVILYNRDGGLLSVNAHDAGLGNFNSLITGSSGSGKSFFNNCMLFQQIARGTKVFVIDIGGSYKKLTTLLNGQYFEVSLSEKYAINPFAISNVQLGPSNEKIKSLVSIIEQMISDSENKLGKLDKVLIEKTLAETFEKAKSRKKSPVLSDFKKECEASSEPELKKIAKLLYVWTGDSPYGKLLDRESELSTNSIITAFDLKGLSQYPDLQAVMILLITNYILDQVENERSIPKRILLDEAWQHLQSPAATSFMEYAARTFRKTGSGISFITQGVEEIVASPIASAILNNTSTKVIMQQRGDLEVLKNTLRLNSQEVSLIQSLEQRKGVFSEAFFIEGDHRQVIRIYPTPMEYWVSTSDSRDNLLLQSMTDTGLTLEDAIEKAASEYPFGVALGPREKAAA